MTKETIDCRISKLPVEIIEQLNQRISSGESFASLIDWLDFLDETHDCIPASFGKCVTAELLEEWRTTGYIEWAISNNLQAHAAKFNHSVHALAKTGLGSESLLIHLTAMYSVVLPLWDGSHRGPLANRLRALGEITGDICNMRKSEFTGQRLALERDKFEYGKSKGSNESVPVSSPVSRSKSDLEESPVRSTPAKRSPKVQSPNPKAPQQQSVAPSAPSIPPPSAKASRHWQRNAFLPLGSSAL